jgi:hypothetical protein
VPLISYELNPAAAADGGGSVTVEVAPEDVVLLPRDQTDQTDRTD